VVAIRKHSKKLHFPLDNPQPLRYNVNMETGNWKVFDTVSNYFLDSYWNNYADAMGWIHSQFGSDQTQFTVVWVPHA
jgi:hypothetical protein